MGLFDRWQDALRRSMIGPPRDREQRSQHNAPPPRDPHSLSGIAGDDNPWQAMLGSKRTFPHRGWRSMHLGAVGANRDAWMTTRHEGHALVLAPPRSQAGKTSGVIIPSLISMDTPVVVTSTKADVVRATAIARAHQGRLWCYAPDGETPIPEGIHELRWSPLTGSEDWGTAIRTAHSMTETLGEQDRQEASHWKDRAADVLSSVFHWAALTDHTMEGACKAVLGLTAQYQVDGKRTRLGDTIARELHEHPRAHPTAAEVVRNVMSTTDRELSSIISTAARAVKVYQLPGAIRSTESPNFDPRDFVMQHWGRSTIYIVSSGENQKLVAPLVVALLNQIRREQYTLIRRIENGDLTPALPLDAYTTTFVLDEMANIAPIPKDDLTSILSEGGSQGLLLMAAVQDLALIEDRWKTAGQSFLTLFGDVIVAPGIRHTGTLDAVSALIGDYDAPSPSMSQSMGHSGPSGTSGMGYQRRRLVPPETVYSGLDPEDGRICIHLSARGNGKISTTSWWDIAPWPEVLAACASCGGSVPAWVQEFRERGRNPEDEPPITELRSPT